MMKKIFILLLVVGPVLGFSQANKKSEKRPDTSFVITGNVTGFANGTPVSFGNQQTNQLEKQATIENGKFIIKGKMDEPGFKVLLFGDQPPFTPLFLFLDNSNVTITGTKDAIDKMMVKGSPSNALFTEYSGAIKKYDEMIAAGQSLEADDIKNIEKISADLVQQNPSSYVSALAIIRMYQLTQNGTEADALFKLLPSEIQGGELGRFANQQIQESKINPIGSVIKDFSQNDTTGKPVNISSFRGQYVLLDFWASWCRPCRMENPNVVAAYNKFHDKNFTILSISLDQAKPAWLNAIQMDGLNWSHVSDLKGWGNEVAALFQVRSIPQNLLIDPNGKIIAKNLRGEVLESKLNELLK
ncbi:MAG: AhpC/TSA family protein [Bacteroidota bacterium]|nr:AhpC/TSA family protein [Bacteroidota bacterium]